MKSKEGLIIDLTVNWQVLALLGVAVFLSVLAYSVAVAQGGEPPVTNDADVAPVADEQQSSPVTVPDSPEAQDGNLAYTTNGEWVARDSIGAAPPSSLDDVRLLSSGGGERHAYLTKTNYATNQALAACASGYHMASLWELYDVSNLIYDYGHPAAYTKADSGHGPPSYWYGWARTGYDSSSSSTAGTGNCNNWSSISSTVYGVSVRLSRMWETAPGDIGPWDATSFTCNFTGPVWCVKD
jgi:hypothetical protein